MELTLLGNVRTNNFTDKDIISKIGGLWGEVIQETADYTGIRYGLYHEYQSDYTGDYTLSIGIEKENSENTIAIEEIGYQIFPVDSSEENGLFLAWKEIWELEENGKLQREYTHDFEKYYPDGKIEIYIKLKKIK